MTLVVHFLVAESESYRVEPLKLIIALK